MERSDKELYRSVDIMHTFDSTFSNHPVVLPVIHVVDGHQAVRNAGVAREVGADGVFLINHDIPYTALLKAHAAVAAAHTDWWVGVNCLDLAPVEVFRYLNEQVAGVWIDNACIDERTEAQCEAESILSARRTSGWQGLYFGGVAFKYQREIEDVASAASIAAGYMDVVTTSGLGTGQAALPGKIRTMKQALGKYPLAVASGITPENVTDYLDFMDYILVATGISTRIDELDAERTRMLVEDCSRGQMKMNGLAYGQIIGSASTPSIH